MNNACMKWKEQLLETALGETAGTELLEHLAQCQDCAAELETLRAKRERMDSLLPLIASAEEPSPELRARIMAATETATVHPLRLLWQAWALAGIIAVVVIAVGVIWIRNRENGELEATVRTAQQLAEWQSPTADLLKVPGQELLNSSPRLGESYLPMTGADSRMGRSQGLKP